MHSCGMSVSCHRKEDVFVLGGPYLHMGSGFTILCKVCSGNKDKKIANFGRFFGEKSDFGGVGKDFGMEKSGVKKSEKNRRFF